MYYGYYKLRSSKRHSKTAREAVRTVVNGAVLFGIDARQPL